MEQIATPTCNTSTLSPFEPDAQNLWDTSKIKHLYRRISFGASQDAVDIALAQDPGTFIETLVNTAASMPVAVSPPWGYWSFNDFTNYGDENFPYFDSWRLKTATDFQTEGLRGRLTFFWMNHFVTEYEGYGHSPYAYQYYRLLQTHALGNLKEFVRALGTLPTMLIYLNGFQNTKHHPNENYARELFELFTLGEGNGYTQSDITEAARALTGYNHWDDYGGAIHFNQNNFDTNEKTIFGQTGNWGYDDVIELLFQERPSEIANFIVEKIYKFFVSPAVDETVLQNIIHPLAQTLIDENFEMAPVFKQLFKSEHFFDDRAKGVIIKSPYDVIFNYINESQFYIDDVVMEALVYYCTLMGQDLYDPQDVSGWQRDETWINTSTLTGRWQLMEVYNGYLYGEGHQYMLANFIRELTNDSNDPAFIVQTVVDHFMSKPLHSQPDYEIATVIFKWEVPQNYYDEGIWTLSWDSAPYQCLLLLNHIAKMPEFQLK